MLERVWKLYSAELVVPSIATASTRKVYVAPDARLETVTVVLVEFCSSVHVSKSRSRLAVVRWPYTR